MKVLLLSRYSYLGASSRVRCYQYIPYLRNQGFDVTVAPLLDDNYIKDLYAGKRKRISLVISSYIQRIRSLLDARSYDLLWIEKELFPWLPAWAEGMLTRLKIPYIVEYDDAVFHRYDLNSNRAVRHLLGHKIDAVMRQAAVVIAGNEYIAKRARISGARRVEILPTVIDLEQYSPGPINRNKIFTIGWIGTPVTARYLHVAGSALTDVCQNNLARVLLVGSGHIALDGVPVEVRPWSKETEVEAIHSFDVGIMPLLDSPWERGKCGYKLIQYMACGRPVVASPVGVNNQIVEDGVNGFLASTKEEWVRALNALIDDHDLRVRMGIAGRKKVETHYCLQVTAPRLAEILHSVCE
ncbi:MAG: glycosyltransferase family 4 protein [Methanothrix sp.]|jgi:glycosyltransferase involved in cell wall biosynthesis|uniref:glycosyltransferase family 4 protein n=1 Tax=Methanothrix sp. TaxID=90426 RepID=UPI00247CFAE2|nr:glycosyltransferase family 4 protein [Methanothrix sp.]